MTDFKVTERIDYQPVVVKAPKACSKRAHVVTGILLAHWRSPDFKGRLGQRDAIQRAMYLGRQDSADPTLPIKLTRELVDVAEAVIGDWIVKGDKRSIEQLVAQGFQLGLDYPDPRAEIEKMPHQFRDPVGTVC